MNKAKEKRTGDKDGDEGRECEASFKGRKRGMVRSKRRERGIENRK